jgi:hypothetical protein
MSIPRMVVGIQPTVHKYFQEPSVGTVNYHTISRQVLHISRTTAAIMTFSWAVIRSVLSDLHLRLQQVVHVTSHEDAVTVINT